MRLKRMEFRQKQIEEDVERLSKREKNKESNVPFS